MPNRLQDSFLQGNNADFLVGLYQQYCHNPSSVTEDWRHYFSNLGEKKDIFFEDDRPPQWIKQPANGKTPSVTQSSSSDVQQAALDSIRAFLLIRAYLVRGHLHANLDPLGIEKRPVHPELLPESYGFSESDWDRPIFINKILASKEVATLREIISFLKETYCGTLGMEFMHIQDPDQKKWIQKRVDATTSGNRVQPNDCKDIMANLIAADAFERFLHVKYPGVKRFGLEGGESLIPGLEALVHQAALYGVDQIIFGTAHRGRLSVLANILKKPIDSILKHFQADKVDPTSVLGSGDVKYHIGYSTERPVGDKKVYVSLEPNPSHLEAVNPVVLGNARARQVLCGDADGKRVMSVLMHGDAAFAGQGLVAETLELSDLKGYRTGGTIHIIINNQIGFTTSPPHSRSSPYSSDIAKAIQAPIVHVNADDPEAVVWAMRFAMDFRREFSRDVVVDMICYRRHGHNEIDEPGFTQPLMYKTIAKHPSTREIYKQKLITSKSMSEQEIDALSASYDAQLKQAFDQQEKGTENSTPDFWAQWIDESWTKLKALEQLETEAVPLTGVKSDILRQVALASIHIPEKFNLHPRIARQLKAKEEIFSAGLQIDWATAEALAFGSLLLEKTPVRLSGQDCGRGTFSQRHLVWVDQETEKKHIAINDIKADQALCEVIDSPLAEASVLGFEYGYSVSNPHSLVMWEAQFGDFSNGAQVIIDQFISSGELKWQQKCGVVMLLPHGFEGQGPEHSSARLERYLQLCAENNMRVVNCSTPANYFHVLRRQLYAASQKPLIVVTPKTLLRHKLAVSSFKDMDEGTCFMTVLEDTTVKPKNVRRVVLCSGKIYYELLQKRQDLNQEDVALIRLEQYYPFPHQRLVDTLKPYNKATFFWCQEEPMNMGAWSFVDRRLERVLNDIGISNTQCHYIGRPEAASPATGVNARHEAEQAYIINHAFSDLDRKVSEGLFAI